MLILIGILVTCAGVSLYFTWAWQGRQSQMPKALGPQRRKRAHLMRWQTRGSSILAVGAFLLLLGSTWTWQIPFFTCFALLHLALAALSLRRRDQWLELAIEGDRLDAALADYGETAQLLTEWLVMLAQRHPEFRQYLPPDLLNE